MQVEVRMNDDDFAQLFKKTPPSSRGASWDDVAEEFQALGKTLGDAVRAAWQRHDDGELRNLRESLASMIEDANRFIDEGVATPEAEQARAQFNRLTESIRQAAEQATEELRPELLRMLRQANAELRKLSGTDD
jgi:hypothetical protein